MIISIVYLTRDGMIGRIDYSGPANLNSIADHLRIEGVSNVAVARVLTDESPKGLYTIDEDYGCHVVYSWMPAELCDVAEAYRLAGREMDACLV